MESKELNFDDGLVQFNVNGKAVVTFNPTDSTFVEKLYGAFDTLDKRQENYKAEIERNADDRAIFETARKLDAEMREIIDEVFGPVSESLFGGMSVYALASGFPVWANFFLAVMDEIDTTYSREQKLTNPRVKKYTDKYSAKYHK